MKNRILSLIVLSFLFVIAVNGQHSNKNRFAGAWKFEAPYAPEGYTSGLIVVGNTLQKDTTTMSFNGYDFKYPCENVKAEKDSIFFSVYVQGDVKILLKLENDTLMSGKAIYSEGEVPLALSKVLTDSTEVKK